MKSMCSRLFIKTFVVQVNLYHHVMHRLELARIFNGVAFNVYCSRSGY